MTEQEENQICGYLFRVWRLGLMSSDLYTSAVRFLATLQRDFPDATMPSVGYEESVMFEWNSDRLHVDAEVDPLGRVEWFWRDRQLDTYDGEQFVTPEAVRGYLGEIAKGDS